MVMTLNTDADKCATSIRSAWTVDDQGQRRICAASSVLRAAGSATWAASNRSRRSATDSDPYYCAADRLEGLQGQCTVLIEAEAQLRAREPVIHSTRVAARRLRSTLRTYAETTDIDRAAALSAELVWFAGLLGEVRDREVLELWLLPDLSELPPELVVGPVAARSRPS